MPTTNIGNAQYIANFTIGGTTTRLLLDTGSSDLWVNFPGTIPPSTDLGKKVSLGYAIGSVSGNVHTADVIVGNVTVKSQAFIEVTDTSSFAGDIHTQGYDGLVGLGPNEASAILDKVDDPSGNTILQRMFQDQGADTANFMTLLLDRKNDTTNPFTGQFTISETVDQFKDILNQPKLDVAEVYKFMESEQHWQVLTDKDNGIIGPDGQVIQVDSFVAKAPDGQLVAVFDSGFTFSQVQRSVADDIYGRVKNAEYDTKNERWLVPCGQLLNLTFNFGGKSFPIHPLDVVNDDFRVKNSKGEHVCIGAFQPITSAFSIFGNFDIILGMSFMRNSYTLMDYGNWLDGSKSKQADPYIQLLSVTDPAAARKEFIDVRLNGQDTTGDAQWQLLPKDQQQSSPESDQEKKQHLEAKVLSHWPYILLGCLVVVAAIIGFIIWRCCCRKGRKPAKGGVFGKKGKKDSYVALQVPQGGLSSTNLPGPGGYGAHHGGGGYDHSRY